MSSYSKGILLVMAAAIAWGGMGVAVQYVLQFHAVDPGELSSLRLLSSGILMVLISFLAGNSELLSIFRTKKLALQVLLSGVILCFAHLTFFFSVYYSNAGTGAIFLATQPLLASLYLCLAKRQFPTGKIVLCMALAFLGVLLIVTDGHLSTLKFSPKCLLWGTASALLAVTYSIQPKTAVTALGAVPVLSWGLMAGGLVGISINPPIHLISSFNLPIGLAFAFIVLIGTIFAFWCYLSSLKFISPVLVGLVVTLEPLSAFVFSIMFLDETLGFFQALGILSIIATVFILTIGKMNPLDLFKRQRTEI